MKSQIPHNEWCDISAEAAGEIGNWSLLGLKGLMLRSTLAGRRKKKGEGREKEEGRKGEEEGATKRITTDGRIYVLGSVPQSPISPIVN